MRPLSQRRRILNSTERIVIEPNEIELANRGLACENLWCLYWQKGFCVLDRVTLDIQGRCDECEYLTPEESELNALRAKVLRDRMKSPEERRHPSRRIRRPAGGAK